MSRHKLVILDSSTIIGIMKFAVLLSLLLANSHAFHVPTQVRPQTSALSAVAEDGSRRNFVAASMAAAASLMVPTMPAHAEDVDYKAVAADIMELVKKNPDWGPSKSAACCWLSSNISLSKSR